MSRSFVPAAGHDLLLPLYDPLWRLMGGARVRATYVRAGYSQHYGTEHQETVAAVFLEEMHGI